MPAERDILGASVIAENCMKADALATACMVLGVDQARQLALDQDCQALLFYADQGEIAETHTAGFPLADAEGAAEEAGDRSKDAAGSFLPIFVAAAAVFLLAIFIMSLGAIIGKRRIKGSCGALASSGQQDIASPCELCQKPAKDCPERKSAEV
jgi:thiamine biosynthesis lipoprotein